MYCMQMNTILLHMEFWSLKLREVATIAEICAKIVEARVVERCNYLYAKIFGTLSSGRANADLLKLLIRKVHILSPFLMSSIEESCHDA